MSTNVSQFPSAPLERVRTASAIRAHLAVRNLSDTKAGAMIGLSQSAMSRRTNAQHPFDIDELGSLADQLGLTIHQLIVMPVFPEGQTLDYGSDVSVTPAWVTSIDEAPSVRRRATIAQHPASVRL